MIEQILNKLKIKNYKIIKKEVKGKSNFNYHIIIDSEKYIMRIPFLNADKYVSYEREKILQDILVNKNLASPYFYFDTKTGIKITKYINGISLDLVNDELIDYQKIFNLVKKMYEIKIDNNEIIDFDIAIFLTKLRNCLKLKDNKFFVKLINSLNDFQKEKAIIHQDIQKANIILDQNNNYNLIDFEYLAYGDIYLDLASIAVWDFNNFFIDNYSIDNKKINLYKLNVYISIFYYRWYLVAFSKNCDKIKAGINFKKLSKSFLKLSKKYFKIANGIKRNNKFK